VLDGFEGVKEYVHNASSNEENRVNRHVFLYVAQYLLHLGLDKYLRL